MEDEAKKGSDMFCGLMAQIVWLSRRLSEARILVNHGSCARCTRMSFEACKACWLEAAAKAVREGRHSK